MLMVVIIVMIMVMMILVLMVIIVVVKDLLQSSAKMSVLFKKRMMLASKNTLLLAIMLNNWGNVLTILTIPPQLFMSHQNLYRLMHLVRLSSLGSTVTVAGQGHTEDNLSKMMVMITR